MISANRMATRNNICIQTFLITSVYSIVKLLFRLLSEVLLTRKTCYICCSLLVVFITRRSLSRRRNVSQINEKAYNYNKASFVLLTSLR